MHTRQGELLWSQERPGEMGNFLTIGVIHLLIIHDRIDFCTASPQRRAAKCLNEIIIRWVVTELHRFHLRTITSFPAEGFWLRVRAV